MREIMRFRPCIDIHNGQVKQIVGSSLRDEKDVATENFVSQWDGAYYSNRYRNDGLYGGHIIILNPVGSPYYEASKKQAVDALRAFKGGMQIGGGITDQNAVEFIEKGASHVIVTSYVFQDGQIHYENLNRISKTVGRERLVLDLSCRKRDGRYYIVTDRWQKFTDVCLNERTLYEFAGYCNEILVHAVDVEGKHAGVEEEVIRMLGKLMGIQTTYAGGVSSYEDIEKIKYFGNGRVDFTVGSALDLFGGHLEYEEIRKMI